MWTQFDRAGGRRRWGRVALCLSFGAALMACACSAGSTSAGPSSTPSPSSDAASTGRADVPGGRDFRRIRRYPGSWIAKAHDTFYIYCPDALVNYRDFRVDYTTTDDDGDRIVDYFKAEMKRSGGYTVAFSERSDDGDRATWRVDFRRRDALLMCRANPSDTSERDVYDGDVRLTVERGASVPTTIQLEVLLNLRADSPY